MTKQEYDKRYYQLHRERILERCKRRYWEKKGDVTKIAEKKAKSKSRYDKPIGGGTTERTEKR